MDARERVGASEELICRVCGRTAAGENDSTSVREYQQTMPYTFAFKDLT